MSDKTRLQEKTPPENREGKEVISIFENLCQELISYVLHCFDLACSSLVYIVYFVLVVLIMISVSLFITLL
ncbi:hypothetical protein UABAM_04545 [Candidatus Uabimicrobium amorphum]|uniref:Uncharacterized protein n=1 Tax=Uabimicrobium amorphum TaxID=2596890 RepID=A0A5S9IQE5_UABAM|nr:hypothetical protein [Candidatus Uabimicrobium amorphum]BBM86159.1 hypothetical protein UABAM_04545 [Candidatus Uabimicrobium amorphum]